MLTLFTTIHIVIAVLLILLVLIQDPKNDGMGGLTGGGSSSSLLGASGASGILVKATRIIAIIFAGTSIFLAYYSSKQNSSVLDSYNPVKVQSPVTKDTSKNLPEEKTTK